MRSVGSLLAVIVPVIVVSLVVNGHIVNSETLSGVSHATQSDRGKKEMQHSGRDDEPVSCSFNSDTGTLTFSGSGAIPGTDSTSGRLPWYDYAKSTTAVVIGNGITSIGMLSRILH